MSHDAKDISPEKLFKNADKVLNQLASLSKAVVDSWEKYHVAPEVRAEAGNAIALIMSLRKVIDTCAGGR